VLPLVALAAACSVFSAESSDKNSPDAIRAQILKGLDAVAAKPSPVVLVIPIREQIDLSTAVYVEREMKRVAQEHVDLALVDINTPGGRGDAMMRICDALLQQKNRSEGEKVPTVAFINNDAFSAGAFISMACGRIYIAPNGKIGAATGYVPGPDGIPVKLPDAVEEKFRSAMTGEVRALAKVNGYPPGIAEAMVDRDQGLMEMEMDGKRELLTEKELSNRKRELGLNDLSPREYAKRVKEVKTICQKGELLTLDYQEAKSVGLATDILGSREAVFAALGLKAPSVIEARHNWSEEVFGFLTMDGVKGILLLLGLMGLYIEFKATGLVLPGILGAVCLALFFFSQYFMGLADYTGALLFGIGAVLVLFEIFVVPGFGIPGVLGILLMIGGVFLGMQPWVLPDVHNPLDMDLFKTNLLILCGVIFAMTGFAVVLAKVLPSTPFLNRIILTSRGPEGELRASATLETEERTLVGAKGRATSRLRPAGRAEIAGKFLDVVADGQFIEEGTSIQVAKVEGNRVIVRKAE
jgi:membrane-bound serine protease (ClpP class)